MKPLPKGITGFRSASDAELPRVDLAEFKRLCYQAARLLGLRVEPVALPPIVNYTGAVLSGERKRVVVLCNLHHPVMGLAADAPFGKKPFLDDPDVAAALQPLDPFALLPATFLGMPPSAELTQLLGRAEREQMDYWRPEQIGDIVFNEWD